MLLPKSLQNAINELGKLPGIGPKSAQRLGLFLLKKDQIDLTLLSESVKNIKQTVSFCKQCHIMSDTETCTVCSDKNRNPALVCVVEESLDAIAIERSRGFSGIFHILGGVLNPLEGIGPDKLQINSLLEKVKGGNIKEIILATNPTLEGETTARYVAKLIKEETEVEIKVTRIARGLPTGGDLEYTDDLTLSRAMEGRMEI